MPRRATSPAPALRAPERTSSLRNNSSYWRRVHARFHDDGSEQDKAFKEAVSKDQEIISAVGAIFMGIAFAGLTQTPYDAQTDSLTIRGMRNVTGSSNDKDKMLAEWQLALRFAYVSLTMLAAGFSSFATLTSMRTSLMLTLHTAADTSELLEMLAERRDARWCVPLRTLYPWVALKWSVVCLLLAVCLYVLCIYSIYEFALSVVVFSFTLLLWVGEDTLHDKTQTQVRKDKREKTE